VTFGHPLWLAAGVFACVLLLLMWRYYDARQHAALARFVAAHLRTQLTQSVSVGRRRAQRLLLLLSVALLFAALAEPLLGFHWELVSRRGIEIVFAIDTSRSMSTPDVKPDRLTRAKLAIDDFTNQLDGDGIGLVAFAGDAFLVCPVTLDYGAFHESLNAIDTGTIPRGGTNITSAIHEAQAALRRRPGSDKILILVTDGEDLEGDALAAAQNAARQDGLKIYTVGVGTPQGDLIPLAGPGGGFVKDDSGAFVKSRLDETALTAIASATGGLYSPLGAQGQGFEYLYKSALAPLLKHDLASRQQRVYNQRYQWPLAASLALLISSLLIGNRRRSRAGARSAASGAPAQASAARSAARAVTPAAVTAVIVTWVLWPPVARASPASAEEAYKRGDFATAAKEYAAAARRDPKTPVLAFNAGAAAYKAGQFPQAATAFQQSISRVPSGDSARLAQQEDAYYNLGNTLYRTGQQTETSSPEKTIETWTQAVKAYDTALQLRHDDADSKFNRDYVQRKIDELKKNPPQNQPQNSPQNSPQNKQNPSQKPNPNSAQPPNSGQPPNGQPPPQQPPPGQPPPGQQPPGQQPPPSAGQPPPQQPQQPPGQQPPPQQPPAGEPPPGQQPPSAGQPKPAPGADQPHEEQPAPGQMTQEEARELLDSQKGDEHHALSLPYARREPESNPDKPFKDW
jgi:Ca-activated chloride channel family protein